MTPHFLRSALLFGIVTSIFAMTGCADLDPYRRTDRWQPEGLADGNMAAMIARPTDLVRGRGAPDSDGGRAASAIAKWYKAGPGGGGSLGGEAFTPGGVGGGGVGGS